MTSVRIKGLEQLQRKLKRIEDLEPIKRAVKDAGTHVREKVSKYPPRKYVSIQDIGGWASDRQRRFFFWALRTGRIEVPYRRGQSPGSEDLGQSWAVKTEKQGMSAVIGNDASYGPFVQDKSRQSRMHKAIGWKTAQDVADEEEDTVLKLIQQAVDNALRG